MTISFLQVAAFAATLFLSLNAAQGWKKRSPPPPDCDVKGDPHFTGADSSRFEFSGVPNTTYCLFSDSHLNINAYFGGYYGKYEDRDSKSITWMREIGVMWGRHAVVLRARQGEQSAYLNGYMASIEIDGQKVTLSKPGDKITFGEGNEGSITWLSAKEVSGDDLIDTYSLDIVGVLSMILELRPEVPHFRTETDGTIHFDLYFPHTFLSDNVHGLLGQTFRSDHRDRISKMKLKYSPLLGKYVVPGDNGEGYLDGNEADYRTSSIIAADSAVNRFVRLASLDPETSLAVEISSGGVPTVLGGSMSKTSEPKSGISTFRRLRRFRLMKLFKLL